MKQPKPWGKETPTLSKDDAERLNPVRANGITLLEYLASGEANTDDLKRLIVLEFLEKKWRKRDYILTRIYTRLNNLTKAQANRILTEHLQENE